MITARSALIVKFISLFVLILVAISFFGEADETIQEKGSVSYTLPNTIDSVDIISPEHPKQTLQPGTYTVKANLSLKKVRAPKIYQTHTIDLQSWEQTGSNSAVPEKEDIQGRQRFNFGEKYPSKEFSWSPKASAPHPSINRFNQLQIDYEELVPTNPNRVMVKMSLQSERTKKNLVAFGGHRERIAPERIILEKQDVSEAPKREKDRFYLIKRVLRLPYDSEWRYAQSGNDAVFQRRFSHKLDGRTDLDLYFSKDTDVKKIKVTLRMGSGNILGETQVIHWGDIIRSPINEFKDRNLLKIHVGELVKHRFRHVKEVYLKELTLFYPNKKADIIQGQFLEYFELAQQKKPLEKFETVGSGKNTPSLKVILPSRIENLSYSKRRLTLDLRHLTEKIDPDTVPLALKLKFQQTYPLKPSGFKILGTRWISQVTDTSPEFLIKGKRWSQRWRNSTLKLEDSETLLEWIRVDARLPFRLIPIEDNAIQISPQQWNFLNTDKPPLKIHGTSVIAEIKLSNISKVFEGIVLEGEGKWLDIDWPVQTRVEKNSRFFLGVSQGAETIQSLQFLPVFIGQKLVSDKFAPNQPVSPTGTTSYLNRLKLRIHFNDDTFRIVLNELALFESLRLPMVEIMDFPSPIEEEISLTGPVAALPSNNEFSYIPNTVQTHSSFSFNKNEVTSGSVLLNRRMDWVRGLQIRYRIRDLKDNFDPCWLHLKFSGSEVETEKVLCFAETSGEMFLPVEKLRDFDSFPESQFIETLDWEILKDKFQDFNEESTPIVLNMQLQGADFRPIRSQLTDYPILNLQKQSIFPYSLNEKTAKRLLNGNFWMDLGSITVPSSKKLTPPVQFLDHPQLKTNWLVFERTIPVSSTAWMSPGEIIGADYDGWKLPRPVASTLKLLMFSLPFFLFWWGKRKNWWSILGNKLRGLYSYVSLIPMIFWVRTAFGLFALGILFLIFGGGNDFRIFFQSGVFILFACWTLKARPWLEASWPDLAGKMYAGPGTPFLFGFLFSLLLAFLFLLIGLSPVAEQTAVIGYWMLIVGVVGQAIELGRNNQENSLPDATEYKDDEVTGA